MNTQKKLDTLSSVLNKTQSDLQKLNDTYNKTVNQLHEEEEKVQKFETNINGEIANRIGEIIQQKIELDKQIGVIRISLSEKDEEIKQLNVQIIQFERELRIEMNEHNDTRDELEEAKVQIKLQKEKVATVQRQMHEKLKEIDNQQ